MSRTMLSQRLKSLEAAGIVTRSAGHEGGPLYELTASGQELRTVVEACGVWASRWLRRDPTTEELDVGLLMWDVRRNIDLAQIPDRDVLVQFSFLDAGRGQRRFWLHLRRTEVDLCLIHPGFEVDLAIESSVLTMTRVWLGRQRLDDAVRTRALRLSGDRRWIRALPRWLKLNPFASVTAPATKRERA